MATKLGRITRNDPPARLAVSIRTSSMRLLEAYQAFYQSETGDPIALKQLVEEILIRFMRRDHDFQQFLGGQEMRASSREAAGHDTGL
jgi:hypothetical protein